MWNGDDKRKKEKNRNNKEIIHNSSNNNNDNNNNEGKSKFSQTSIYGKLNEDALNNISDEPMKTSKNDVHDEKQTNLSETFKTEGKIIFTTGEKSADNKKSKAKTKKINYRESILNYKRNNNFDITDENLNRKIQISISSEIEENFEVDSNLKNENIIYDINNDNNNIKDKNNDNSKIYFFDMNNDNNNNKNNYDNDDKNKNKNNKMKNKNKIEYNSYKEPRPPTPGLRPSIHTLSPKRKNAKIFFHGNLGTNLSISLPHIELDVDPGSDHIYRRSSEPIPPPPRTKSPKRPNAIFHKYSYQGLDKIDERRNSSVDSDNNNNNDNNDNSNDNSTINNNSKNNDNNSNTHNNNDKSDNDKYDNDNDKVDGNDIHSNINNKNSNDYDDNDHDNNNNSNHSSLKSVITTNDIDIFVSDNDNSNTTKSENLHQTNSATPVRTSTFTQYVAGKAHKIFVSKKKEEKTIQMNFPS